MCDCGREVDVQARSLKSGNTKSCGCHQKARASETHKLYNTYDLCSEYGKGFIDSDVFLFDLEDYDKIKDIKWFLDKDGYVCGNQYIKGERCGLRLHRLIMQADDAKIHVDHINHDTLDNRKQNLRLATPQQNQMNEKLSINNKSGKTGVSKVNKSGKWIARINVNRKAICLGTFDALDDAINARYMAEKKYYGEYAYKGGKSN